MTEQNRKKYEEYLTNIKKTKGHKEFMYKQIIGIIQHLYAMEYMDRHGTLEGSWIADMPEETTQEPEKPTKNNQH